MVEKIYENGDLYFGQLKDDKKDGLGQLISKNGDFYLGNWSQDQKDGKGKMMYVDS